MKFGIFDYIDDRGEPLHKTYDDRLALLQAAEAAGFYGYHLTEHHAPTLKTQINAVNRSLENPRKYGYC